MICRLLIHLKTFLLNSNFLNIDLDNSIYVGIAENNKSKIYAVDISDLSEDINVGYENIVEYDTRHLLAISNPDDIVLMGRANQLLHWIKSNKYSGYTGELNEYDNKETVDAAIGLSTGELLEESVQRNRVAIDEGQGYYDENDFDEDGVMGDEMQELGSEDLLDNDFNV